LLVFFFFEGSFRILKEMKGKHGAPPKITEQKPEEPEEEEEEEDELDQDEEDDDVESSDDDKSDLDKTDEEDEDSSADEQNAELGKDVPCGETQDFMNYLANLQVASKESTSSVMSPETKDVLHRIVKLRGFDFTSRTAHSLALFKKCDLVAEHVSKKHLLLVFIENDCNVKLGITRIRDIETTVKSNQAVKQIIVVTVAGITPAAQKLLNDMEDCQVSCFLHTELERFVLDHELNAKSHVLTQNLPDVRVQNNQIPVFSANDIVSKMHGWTPNTLVLCERQYGGAQPTSFNLRSVDHQRG
jgi:hypothetical protein